MDLSNLAANWRELAPRQQVARSVGRKGFSSVNGDRGNFNEY